MEATGAGTLVKPAYVRGKWAVSLLWVIPWHLPYNWRKITSRKALSQGCIDPWHWLPEQNWTRLLDAPASEDHRRALGDVDGWRSSILWAKALSRWCKSQCSSEAALSCGTWLWCSCLPRRELNRRGANRNVIDIQTDENREINLTCATPVRLPRPEEEAAWKQACNVRPQGSMKWFSPGMGGMLRTVSS